MRNYLKKAGASPDQGFSALTQANTCMAIIPPEQMERLIVTMPAFSAEQAFWIRRAERMLRRELARMECERHTKLVDTIMSVASAASLAFLLYCWLFLGLL